MAKNKKVNISSSNAEGLRNLYEIYIEQTGESPTYDDFIQFLSIASPERSIFFDTWCNWQAVDLGVAIVIKVDPKTV